MRIIFGITLLLAGVAMLSCRHESATHAESPMRPALEWVRTADGWERPDAWLIAPVRAPQLHPLVVAVGQGLASVMALLAFRSEEE